jgi:hypothetical protein
MYKSLLTMFLGFAGGIGGGYFYHSYLKTELPDHATKLAVATNMMTTTNMFQPL